MTRRPPALAVALFSVLGCATPHEEAAVDAPSELGKRVGVDQVPTTEASVGLFDGYHALLDTRLPACVRPREAREPVVGQVAQETTIRLVRNEEELSRDLGVDASLTGKAPFGSANATASLVRSFKSSSQHVNYLIQSVHSYRVLNTANVELTESALDTLGRDPSAFLTRCGDRYVSDITYQGRIIGLLTFETSSEEALQTLQGELGASGAVAPVEASATVKARLSDLAKRSDVSALMHVVVEGFEVGPNKGLLGLGGSVEEKLARMDALASELGDSLRRDQERDATSYSQNRLRNAVPALVGLWRYGQADNAPPGTDTSEAFRAHRDKQRGAEAYLRALAHLKRSMARVYADELFPVLLATDAEAAHFNVAPPAEPLRGAAEVRMEATLWAKRFEEGGAVPGLSEYDAVSSAMADCADDARYGAFTACHLGEQVTVTPAYLAARAALDEYVKKGRIGRLSVTAPTADEVIHSSAVAQCATGGKRLPTPEEAKLLSPLVAGALGGPKHTIWTAESASCSRMGGQAPLFVSDESSWGPRCQRRALLAEVQSRVLCVPMSGPLVRAADL